MARCGLLFSALLLGCVAAAAANAGPRISAGARITLSNAQLSKLFADAVPRINAALEGKTLQLPAIHTQVHAGQVGVVKLDLTSIQVKDRKLKRLKRNHGVIAPEERVNCACWRNVADQGKQAYKS